MGIVAVHKETESEQFNKAWKEVKSQSERQLGAYIFTYSFLHNECPKLLSQIQVKFRNNVVHKGLIPTRTEAIAYGDAVAAAIVPGLKMLFKECGDEAIMKRYWSEVKYPERTSDDIPISGRSLLSIFGQNPTYWPRINEISIEKHVDAITSKRMKGSMF